MCRKILIRFVLQASIAGKRIKQWGGEQDHAAEAYQEATV